LRWHRRNEKINKKTHMRGRELKALIDIAHFLATHPLSREAPLKSWMRFTYWQIKSRIQHEVIVPWVGGQRLVLQRGMTGGTGNIYVGLHEFADMMLLLHFLRAGDVFVDIGANIGTYSILASGVCRARTLAFEPDPYTLWHLGRNVSINYLDNLVTVRGCALGADRGTVPFTVGRDTMNRIAVAGDRNVRMVPQELLDDFAHFQPIMIKADVEGNEENVLRGAQVLLAGASLKVIELETVTEDTARLLASNRFERAHYNPFTRDLSREKVDDLAPSNSLFVRDWPFVAARLKAGKEIEVLGRCI
jgi:FkbM family methyltransferase